MRHANVPNISSYPSARELARSWDRDRDRAPIAEREPPWVLPWWCVGGCGGGYTDRGSFELGYCTRCGSPDPRRNSAA